MKKVYAVVGSRTYNNYGMMEAVLDKLDISYIVSGGAVGADTVAKLYAHQNYIRIVEFKPDWGQFGKRAGYIRNIKIVQEADEIVAFWDGESPGTKHTIELAKKAGKPVIIIRF